MDVFLFRKLFFETMFGIYVGIDDARVRGGHVEPAAAAVVAHVRNDSTNAWVFSRARRVAVGAGGDLRHEVSVLKLLVHRVCRGEGGAAVKSGARAGLLVCYRTLAPQSWLEVRPWAIDGAWAL